MDIPAFPSPPVYLGGPGWGALPVQGRTSDGKLVWGFTLEQLTSPDAAIVLVPTMASAVDLSRLRGNLRGEQERTPPESSASPGPVVRDRLSTGEPMNKTRKAVQPHPSALTSGASASADTESGSRAGLSAMSLAATAALRESLDSGSSSSSSSSPSSPVTLDRGSKPRRVSVPFGPSRPQTQRKRLTQISHAEFAAALRSPLVREPGS